MTFTDQEYADLVTLTDFGMLGLNDPETDEEKDMLKRFDILVKKLHVLAS